MEFDMRNVTIQLDSLVAGCGTLSNSADSPTTYAPVVYAKFAAGVSFCAEGK
jgi:hypothetical protein